MSLQNIRAFVKVNGVNIVFSLKKCSILHWGEIASISRKIFVDLSGNPNPCRKEKTPKNRGDEDIQVLL